MDEEQLIGEDEYDEGLSEMVNALNSAKQSILRDGHLTPFCATAWIDKEGETIDALAVIMGQLDRSAFHNLGRTVRVLGEDHGWAIDKAIIAVEGLAKSFPASEAHVNDGNLNDDPEATEAICLYLVGLKDGEEHRVLIQPFSRTASLDGDTVDFKRPHLTVGSAVDTYIIHEFMDGYTEDTEEYKSMMKVVQHEGGLKKFKEALLSSDED